MIDMEEVHMVEDIKGLKAFLMALHETGSRKAKEEILRGATEFQKSVLEFLLNPYKVTGISKKKMEGFYPIVTGMGMGIMDMIKYFETHQTGSDRDIAFVMAVAGETGDAELVKSIAMKNITLGVSAGTVNKIWPNFIPTFSVQLANGYFNAPEKLVPQGTEFILTEKLDGVRCVLIFENGEPHFFSRSGREFENLVELEKEAMYLEKQFVYDGELVIADKGASNELYRRTMSIVGSDKVKTGIAFNVFDMVWKDNFMKGYEDAPASARKQALHNRLTERKEVLKFIREVPILYSGTDRDEIQKWHKKLTDNGAEGVMINISDAPYICDRNNGLLKVKKFKECEAIVRAVQEGGGRHAGRMGSIAVEIKDEKGNLHPISVGSGFTDEERDYYFSNREDIVGKVVEVGYFEVTRNKDNDDISLRFPTWLGRIRLDKDEDSMSAI